MLSFANLLKNGRCSLVIWTTAVFFPLPSEDGENDGRNGRYCPKTLHHHRKIGEQRLGGGEADGVGEGEFVGTAVGHNHHRLAF